MVNQLYKIGLFIIGSCILLSCSKEKGCMDSAALNFNADAKQNCCCEYDLSTETNLQLSLKHTIKDQSLTQNAWLEGDSAGFSISLIRYYISNFFLINNSGVEVPFSDSIVFVDGFNTYSLDFRVPIGEFKAIGFHWGIDSVRNNASQPAQFPASHPLGAKSPSMYWSWATDYLFCKIEGKYRKSDMVENQITWHVGTDAIYGKTEIPIDVLFEQSITKPIGIEFDLNVFANMLELPKEAQTHSAVLESTLKKFKTYFPMAFKLE